MAVIALGYAFYPEFTSAQSSQTAGALLLLGPTLLAASLIRPGEHRLATSVLIGVRTSLVLQMAAAAFAVSIIVGVGGDIRKTLWLGALMFAALIQVGLCLSFVLPRPTKL